MLPVPSRARRCAVSLRQRGLALVAVLWIVVALGILVGSIVAIAKSEIRAAQIRVQSVRTVALGDAAIQLAVLDWQNAAPTPDRLMRAVYTFDGVDVAVEIVPATGYINLNNAQEPLLQALFMTAAGLSADEALTLAQRVIDWRDIDDAPMPQGAEAEQYFAAEVSWRPRNGRFLAPEDLMQVLGVDFDLFAIISPFVTAWSGAAGVNPLAAPETVLGILCGGDASCVARIATARDAGEIGIDTTMLEQSYLATGNVGNILHVSASLPVEPGLRAVRERWVQLAADVDGSPWKTLRAEPVRFVAVSRNEF
ncbi:MAG: general secretion pathway protein GspK [Azoarcus sp.]|nr:general secretion pathway protein GspK [Azoarcus sp.]